MIASDKKIEPTKGYGNLPPDVPNLFSAAARNDLEKVNVALEHYDIDATDDHGMTALHHAAGYNAFDVVDLLLNRGINPAIKDDFGRLASWVSLEVLGPELGSKMANKLGPICNNYD